MTADIILKKLKTIHAKGVQNIALNPFSKILTHLSANRNIPVTAISIL